MSEEEIKVELSQEELTDQELKDLIKKVVEEGSQEARYILTLTLDRDLQRPRRSITDNYQVLYGEVREIETERLIDGNREIINYAIIPLTRTVVLLTYDGEKEPTELYVFSAGQGWKKLYL